MSRPKHSVARLLEGSAALDRPVHAPEAAEGTTEPAVALHVALGSAVHGEQTTPTNRRPWQTGSES